MHSITEDFKALVLNTKKDLENKIKIIDEHCKMIQATKKEHQNPQNENIKL